MSASTALRCAVSSAWFTQVLGFVRARLGWVGLGCLSECKQALLSSLTRLTKGLVLLGTIYRQLG
jgi:hypothetical protein